MRVPKITSHHEYDESKVGTLEKVAALGERLSANSMHDHGEVPPLWVLVSETEGIFSVLTPWDDERDKQLMLAFIRAFIEQAKVTRYVMMSEVWLAHVDKNTPEELAEKMPVDRPDRKEMVMVSAFEEGKADHRHVAMFDILRADREKPVLRKSDEFQKWGYWQGRMFNLFESEQIEH